MVILQRISRGFSAGERVSLIAQTALPAKLKPALALPSNHLWSFSASATKQLAKLGFRSLQLPRWTLPFRAWLSSF
jgi:hypothetical protein